MKLTKTLSSRIFSTASLAAGLLALGLAVPAASAQVGFGVTIGAPPPPLRYEVRPASPGAGFVWTEGFYEPYNSGYRWHGGYWQRPPYEGAYYVHPHWDHYPDGWHQHEGYWAHGGPGEGFHDHDSHYWENHPH